MKNINKRLQKVAKDLEKIADNDKASSLYNQGMQALNDAITFLAEASSNYENTGAKEKAYMLSEIVQKLAEIEESIL